MAGYTVTAQEVLDHTHISILRDTPSGGLWVSDRVILALNEAYIEFCERTFIIRDSSDTFNITLADGVADYEYPAQVLSVLTARPSTGTRNLSRLNDAIMHGEQPYSDATTWLQQLSSSQLAPGEPQGFSTDDSLRTLKVYPTPTADQDGEVLVLRVVRLPNALIDSAALDAEIELPRQYAFAICNGAAALCYLDQDSDGYDPKRAAAQRTEFERYVERANAGRLRQMIQAPAFSFGSNGMSYTR